jgi:hypothetical protein
MNKFRVLTTNGEWVYTAINVMEDCIRCPLMDKDGKQVLNPNIQLRKETFSMLVMHDDEGNGFYGGDIVKITAYDEGEYIFLLALGAIVGGMGLMRCLI